LRWSDDLNTLPIKQVTVIDTRVNFHVLPKTDLYVGVDNVLDAEVQTALSGDGIVNIEAPRLFRLGLRYTY
jgi:outer membrane receptor protein involved in Fe transport